MSLPCDSPPISGSGPRANLLVLHPTPLNPSIPNYFRLLTQPRCGIAAAHLLVVKDNSGKRKIGEILEAIGGDESIKGAATSASDRLKAGGGGILAVSAAVGLITPVVSLIGGLLKKKKDKVIATISGSVFLNAERKRRDQLSDTIRSADGNVTVDANALLFDGTADDDFEALENPDLGLELAGQVRAANV